MHENIPTLLDIPHHKQEPMNQETATILLKLLTAEQNMHPKGDELLENLQKNHLGGMLITRIQHYQLTDKISPYALFLVFMLSQTPAHIAMWMHAVHLLHKKNNQKITIQHITQHFSNGFPTDKQLDVIWDKIKKVPRDTEFTCIIDDPRVYK